MGVLAFHLGSEIHLLDHIAPLVSLLQIPLLVTEEETAGIAKSLYPEVEIRFVPDLEFRFKELTSEFDTFLGCKFWDPQSQQALRTSYGKKIRFAYCPHGQSDKGYDAPLLLPFATHDLVFLYGDLMEEMLKELNVSIPAHVKIGNYRLRYHELHRERQCKMADQHIFHGLDLQNRTLLYAPTCQGADRATTFFLAAEKVIRELPSDWNLILKIHPMLPEKEPALFYRLSILEEKKPNLRIVQEFPLIYPILEKMDVYLGDYSSIGYDALAFRKPMFFWQLPHMHPARLHSCGQILNLSKNTFQSIEEGLTQANQFLPKQESLYRKAFRGCLQCELLSILGFF